MRQALFCHWRYNYNFGFEFTEGIVVFLYMTNATQVWCSMTTIMFAINLCMLYISHKAALIHKTFTWTHIIFSPLPCVIYKGNLPYGPYTPTLPRQNAAMHTFSAEHSRWSRAKVIYLNVESMEASYKASKTTACTINPTSESQFSTAVFLLSFWIRRN